MSKSFVVCVSAYQYRSLNSSPELDNLKKGKVWKDKSPSSHIRVGLSMSWLQI